MTCEELKKTPSFKYKNKILPLIKVLDDLYNITFFHFGRMHHKLGKITIGNSLDFALRYWNEYADVDPAFVPQRIHDTTLFIYDGEKTSVCKKERQMFEVRLQQYNLSDQGIILVRRTSDYTDTFNFSSVKFQNDRINPLLRSHRELNMYCDFFLKEVADILKDSENYNTTLTSERKLRHDEVMLENKPVSPTVTPNYHNPSTQKFVQECLAPVQSIALTEMEARCLYWAVRGKTAEETALILDNSRRTIESHLAALRTKFGYSRTSMAILKAEELGFIHHGQVFTKPTRR